MAEPPINSSFFDTLIIGSGIAGLNLARKLAQAGQTVFICSKEAVTEGSSKYAQGGVAVYSPLNVEDNLESHINDTVRAGKGLCKNETVVKILEQGWDKVEELIKLGVKFDKTFNIEGSHSYKRVMHVADATGRAIMRPLLDNVSCNHNVSISQGTECLSLIKKDNEIIGALIETVSGERYQILANNTVLASGGLSSLYAESTNPKICTGDGIALAYDAGAEIENLEFIQFHPTVFKTKAGKNFLISEAVRGAGALLRNSKKELFAQNYHPDAELATRDVVSRAIVQEMRITGADFVYLDFTKMTAEVLNKEFPNITKTCLKNGYDISKDLLPVRPAAHYTIGGIKTDLSGKTNIEHLYAVGECASTGLHGANRLASNSLLECIVMPDFLAQDILNQDCPSTEVPRNDEIMTGQEGAKLTSKASAPLESYYQKNPNKNTIQEILSKYLGIERSQETIEQALSSLEELPDCKAKTTAILIAKSALARKESRGSHFRVDFPQAFDNLAQASILSKTQNIVLN